MEDSCCVGLIADGETIEKPNLTSAHGPMAQAILYSMDSWHCLARRGVTVDSLPVVVLAGIRAKEEEATGTKSNSFVESGENICCLEACVQIPEYCGTPFMYSVDRIVSFKGTTGLFQGEEMSDGESKDMCAIAIYLRTMRFGLEKAIMTWNNRCKGVPPASLCCHNLLNGVTDTKVIASSVRREKHLRKCGLKIGQGDLFLLKEPTKRMFSRHTQFLWFSDFKVAKTLLATDCHVKDDDKEPLATDCLVKVSCASVHNFYVPCGTCNVALMDLYFRGAPELKKKIAEVLLGYCYWEDSKTLMSIMKDLRTGDKTFKILEHRNFHGNQLCKLWKAFRGLVMSLLLPMANLDVIHLDIRSDRDCTYNILVYEDQYEVKLRLIDYDSVACSTAAACIDEVGQDDAICINLLGDESRSSYGYLFWQVLWIAYRWHPSTQQMTPKAKHFVSHLFEDGEYVEFKTWLGDHAQALKSRMNRNISATDITDALKMLKASFRESSSCLKVASGSKRTI
jgi:hypothetical protein